MPIFWDGNQERALVLATGAYAYPAYLAEGPKRVEKESHISERIL